MNAQPLSSDSYRVGHLRQVLPSVEGLPHPNSHYICLQVPSLPFEDRVCREPAYVLSCLFLSYLNLCSGSWISGEILNPKHGLQGLA